MIYFLVVAYLLMAALFLVMWLNAFQKDTGLSDNEKVASLIVLSIASLFWPIVVPISKFELLIKTNTNIDNPAGAIKTPQKKQSIQLELSPVKQ